MQFSPGVWTSVDDDLIRPIDFDYGISGKSPSDRVADTGTLHGALNNSANNSQKKVGLYSPGHANARSGFKLGTPVRAWFAYDPLVPTYYKWNGRISEIAPIPGLYGEQRTIFQAVDWMDEAARATVKGLDVQTNKRSDELITTLLNSMVKQPITRQIGFGMETYPFAFDTARDEGLAALGEIQKICNSELGFFYPKGDSVNDGLVVFEDRRARGTNLTSVATFTSVNALDPKRSRDNIFNRVLVKMHPRRQDASLTVIYTQQDKPFIPRGTSYTIKALYKDNSQDSQRIGAQASSVQIPPTATTDYLFNTAQDGSGTNITSQLSFTGTVAYGNAADIVVTNNGPQDGYLNLNQLRGIGIYDNGEVIFEAADATSQADVGDQSLPFEMPYQAQTEIARQAAYYLLNTNKTEDTIPEQCGFICGDATFTEQAIVREISDRITIQDEVTGVSADFFINRVQITVDEEYVMHCTWTLAPASRDVYWILDSATQSQLDQTTKLAYGLWNRFWLLGVSTTGTDTRLST
jgi:hypothetical protein